MTDIAVMNAKPKTGLDPSDVEPSRMWWLISGIWALMFSLVLVFVLLAEYTRYEQLENRLAPAPGQARLQL
ncbi:MAG: hypothetical protein JST38_01975 [Bacteroidetes bacterium]|nr:hypothetical protein [Bacteroidota bacterium]